MSWFEVVEPEARRIPLQNIPGEGGTVTLGPDGQAADGPVLQRPEPGGSWFEPVGLPARRIEAPGALQVAREEASEGAIGQAARSAGEFLGEQMQRPMVRGFTETVKGATLGSEALSPDAPIAARVAGGAADWVSGKTIGRLIDTKLDNFRERRVPDSVKQFNELMERYNFSIPASQWPSTDRLFEVIEYGQRYPGALPRDVEREIINHLERTGEL